MGEAGPEVFVHLLPSLVAPGALAGGVAVVVDVLRATTAMVHALAAGASSIIPCREVEEARRVAAGLPAGSAVLAGERKGLPIEGFDLGNSPDDFTPSACRGKTLVMTTTNGTLAVLASLDADRVGIGARVNANAAARWAGSTGLPVHLVCAGTDGEVSYEDTLVAGEVARALGRSWAYRPGNDSALLALDAADLAGRAPTGPAGAPWLHRGRGGRRVLEIGLGRDLDAASRRDRFALVPVLRRDPLRIVAAAEGHD